MTDEDLCHDLLHDADHDAAGEGCAHWNVRGLCSEGCSCGHGCGEHWAWGGCSFCECIAFEEQVAPFPRRLPVRALPAPAEYDELDDAAGF
ncbi:MAG: hypothetical protein WKG00_17760 [Polyangiaceae bacterium]